MVHRRHTLPISLLTFQPDSVRKGSVNSSEQPRLSVSWRTRQLGSQISRDRGEDGVKKDKPPESGVGTEIGLLYGGSLVMNAIIGPGIFGTPKGVLAGVGSVGMSLVMWTFSGMFSMCAALCFAELRESVKREGVEYAYITEAFGPVAGFAYTWMRIAAAEPTATAVFALVFTDYMADAIYDDCGPTKLFIHIVATLAVLSMFLVNVMSTKLSERIQMVCSVGKVSALSVVIFMGIKRIIDGELTVINEGFKGSKWSPTDLAFACYNGLWAYGGWANVNHVTSGIKKPPRNVPRVVKTILPLVLVIYLMTVLSYFTSMTREDLLESRAIGVTWAQRVLGPASSLIYIGVGLTALGSLNGTLLSAGRLSGVAAKNGQMPDVVSWVHVRSKTPLVAIGMRCLIAVMVMMLADGQELLRFYIFVVWLFHGTSIMALLILRYKNKKKKRPYKVDLWIPILVVTVIAYLLIAPFLQKPEKEFVAAVSLLGVCLLCYYPITWLKSKSIINVPDKITIWLQLLLRIAPKRDLRRERKSLIRQMEMIARDSIIITPNVMPSPAAMRRFSRRMSPLQLVQGSPALMRRFADSQGQTSLRRRINRGNSLVEFDLRQRSRSSSVWTSGSENTSSPAYIRRKGIGHNRSLSQSDIAKLKSPPSLPSLSILKNRYTTTPEVREEKKLGAFGLSKSVLSLPHQLLRPSPSPIPEEDASVGKPMDSTADETKSQGSQEDKDFKVIADFEDDGGEGKDFQVIADSEDDGGEDKDFQVIADFESDGGGEYEVLAHSDDVRRMSCDAVSIPESNSNDSSSSSDSESTKSDKTSIPRNSIFTNLFNSSSSSSSDSDSSTEDEEEDDTVDERVDEQALPRFYQSDDDAAPDGIGDAYDNSEGLGYINNGFVFGAGDQHERQDRQREPDLPTETVQGLEDHDIGNTKV